MKRGGGGAASHDALGSESPGPASLSDVKQEALLLFGLAQHVLRPSKQAKKLSASDGTTDVSSMTSPRSDRAAVFIIASIGTLRRAPMEPQM
mmetsp:Transcript_29780/g.44901  ORF Transcript_29780/g.44901 Transcript_29780/m.44901 type:complete len:92 (+) Transcript_29780:140-415(+)